MSERIKDQSISPSAVGRARAPLLAAALLGVVGALGPAQVPIGQKPPEYDFQPVMGAAMPLEARFQDEEGRAVTLGECTRGRPAILTLIYYDCPMLCGLVLKGLVGALTQVELNPGTDFEVVAISIDPEEKPELARAKKESTVRRFHREGTEHGWHFLTGSESEIRKVADAAGFRYSKVEATGEYAHASGILILTPDGRISRVLYKPDFAPRDVRLGLVEASAGGIGTAADRVLLLCYAWDPESGTYGFAIMRALRIAAFATVAMIVGFVGMTLVRDRRRRRDDDDPPSPRDAPPRAG